MESSNHTLRAEERPDLDPVCPHCEAKLDSIYTKGIESWLGKRFVYFCPRCRKVLGITHRKGFWMG